MGLVYLFTLMVDFYGKMQVNLPVPGILWVPIMILGSKSDFYFRWALNRWVFPDPPRCFLTKVLVFFFFCSFLQRLTPSGRPAETSKKAIADLNLVIKSRRMMKVPMKCPSIGLVDQFLQVLLDCRCFTVSPFNIVKCP